MNKLDKFHIDFYKEFKQRLIDEGTWIFSSKNKSTDIIGFDWKKQTITLYKIVIPKDMDKVNIWTRYLKKWHNYMWFCAYYCLIYIDKNGKEFHRTKILLKT